MADRCTRLQLDGLAGRAFGLIEPVEA
jgi:hypothetical protein